MKIIYSVIFLIFSFSTNSKYARWVFNIPCHGVKLKVTECQDHSFTNKDLIKNRNSRSRIVSNSGSILKGKIESIGPVKCNEKQKIDLSKYEEEKLTKDFFVKDRKCSDIKSGTSTTLVVQRLFCDTPRAVQVPECFISMYSRQNNFYYSH